MATDNHFCLETNGHCLLCFRLVTPLNQPAPLQSIQSFVNNFKISSWGQLNGLSQDLELVSVLCQECGMITGRFSELAAMLRRIQNELKSCRKSIKEKVTFGERGLSRLMGYRRALRSNDDFNYGIVNSFRNEILKAGPAEVIQDSEPKQPIIGFIPPTPPVNIREVLNHCSTEVKKSNPKSPVIGFIPPPINYILRTERKGTTNAVNVPLSALPLWRRSIIARVTKRLEKTEDQRKSLKAKQKPSSAPAPLGLQEDPHIRFPLEYSSVKMCLTVASKFQISFDDKTKSLVCKTCGWSKVTKNMKTKDPEMVIYTHILSKHLRMFNCPKPGCGKKYSVLSAYRIHLDTHRNDDLITPVSLPKAYECDRCKSSFTSRMELTSHKRYHHLVDNPSQEEQSITPEEMVKDERTCEICNETFTRFYPIPVKGNFNCEICHLSFPGSIQLCQHRKRGCWNLSSKEFPCNVCRRTFNSLCYLEQHQAKKHPDQGKCDKCLINLGRAVKLEAEAENSDDESVPSVPIPIQTMEISHDPYSLAKIEKLYKLEAQESMPVPIENEESMESLDMESNYKHSVVNAELFYDEGESDNDQFILPDES